MQQTSLAAEKQKCGQRRSHYGSHCTLGKTVSSGSQTGNTEVWVRSEEVQKASANYSFKKFEKRKEKGSDGSSMGYYSQVHFKNGKGLKIFIFRKSHSIQHTRHSNTYPSFPTCTLLLWTKVSPRIFPLIKVRHISRPTPTFEHITYPVASVLPRAW